MESNVGPKEQVAPDQPALVVPRDSSTNDVSPDSYDNGNMEDEKVTTTIERTEPQQIEKRGMAFWLIVAALCLAILSASMDATIVVTAFPTIVRSIGGETQYVWVTSCFLLASVSVQTLVAHLSDIFGRSQPLRISLVLFLLGSGLAGGANSVGMLIAARTIQGLGCGGIMVLAELVVCDLVSLRERGKFLGIIMSFAGIGVTLGPIFGGAIAEKNWRWVFYINLPICGLALAVTVFFMRMKHKREANLAAALRRVDWFGSALFIASICSILLGLIMGGTVHPWSSFRVIVPLVLGFVGWICFHFFEASSFCKEPSVPPRIFGNRTTFTSIVLGFIAGMLLQWGTFFLPIYFMGVLGTSPVTAGVDILPYTILIIPFSIISGGIITKFGVYRPIHGVAFALLAISFGLFSILKSSSSKAEWVIFPIINAAGTGLVMMALLTSTLAPLKEADVGTATGTFSFMRSFGMVWGTTIPSIIFNARFNKFISEIDNSGIRAMLFNGGAYGYASNGFINSLSAIDKSQVVTVYAKALKTIWQAAAAFAAFGFLLVFLEKHHELRTELNTEFGIDKKKMEKEEEATAV